MKPSPSSEATPGAGCSYTGRSGTPCSEPAQGEAGLCFWHDPNTPKTGADIKERLEALARQGRPLEGFVLRSADLRAVELVEEKSGKPVSLADADLSRANLQEAHFFQMDLRGANLMKANLSDANLNRASLEDTNLLGAELVTTRLEQVKWGRHLDQELRGIAAERAGRIEEAMNLYLEAEEVYRYLTKINEAKGHFTLAGHFYHKEKIMRRMQMRRGSKMWLWSKTVDMLCGYGEIPERVIGFSLLVILGWAVVFFFLGINGPEGTIRIDPAAGWAHNLGQFFICAYFSVVTFTTLGFGDITPTGIARAFAALEAFIGAFSISLFVVVFVRKMTR